MSRFCLRVLDVPTLDREAHDDVSFNPRRPRQGRIAGHVDVQNERVGCLLGDRSHRDKTEKY